ncbi:hypothetical protein GF325_04140 [Candidatus Bathyarchaeota archaeon]|nr:hypothetical protein [Candidatus Bathyarchaeota archaeon]
MFNLPLIFYIVLLGYIGSMIGYVYYYQHKFAERKARHGKKALKVLLENVADEDKSQFIEKQQKTMQIIQETKKRISSQVGVTTSMAEKFLSMDKETEEGLIKEGKKLLKSYGSAVPVSEEQRQQDMQDLLTAIEKFDEMEEETPMVKVEELFRDMGYGLWMDTIAKEIRKIIEDTNIKKHAILQINKLAKLLPREFEQKDIKNALELLNKSKEIEDVVDLTPQISIIAFTPEAAKLNMNEKMLLHAMTTETRITREKVKRLLKWSEEKVDEVILHLQASNIIKIRDGILVAEGLLGYKDRDRDLKKISGTDKSRAPLATKLFKMQDDEQEVKQASKTVKVPPVPSKPMVKGSAAKIPPVTPPVPSVPPKPKPAVKGKPHGSTPPVPPVSPPVSPTKPVKPGKPVVKVPTPPKKPSTPSQPDVTLAGSMEKPLKPKPEVSKGEVKTSPSPTGGKESILKKSLPQIESLPKPLTKKPLKPVSIKSLPKPKPQQEPMEESIPGSKPPVPVAPSPPARPTATPETPMKQEKKEIAAPGEMLTKDGKPIPKRYVQLKAEPLNETQRQLDIDDLMGAMAELEHEATFSRSDDSLGVFDKKGDRVITEDLIDSDSVIKGEKGGIVEEITEKILAIYEKHELETGGIMQVEKLVILLKEGGMEIGEEKFISTLEVLKNMGLIHSIIKLDCGKGIIIFRQMEFEVDEINVFNQAILIPRQEFKKETLAAAMNLSEEQVLELLKKMQEKGVLRYKGEEIIDIPGLIQD